MWRFRPLAPFVSLFFVGFDTCPVDGTMHLFDTRWIGIPILTHPTISHSVTTLLRMAHGNGSTSLVGSTLVEWHHPTFNAKILTLGSVCVFILCWFRHGPCWWHYAPIWYSVGRYPHPHTPHHFPLNNNFIEDNPWEGIQFLHGWLWAKFLVI